MKYLFTLLIALSLVQISYAQWVTDTMTRNPICTTSGVQNEQQLCTDGNKGAYIAWEDYRGGTHSKIYAQLIDSGGNIKWLNNGIAFSDTTISCVNPHIVPDLKGGAILTWELYGAYDNIYATHINKAGSTIWKRAQLPVDTINDDRLNYTIPDGHGGAIINWYSYIYGTGDPVVVQWLDSTGKAYLPINGLQISDPNGAHYSSDVVTDNNYHAYIVYYDYDTIRVQKIDTAGNMLWGKGGVILSTSYDDDGSGHSHQSASDGNGGIIIGWDDNRFNPVVSNLFAQRLDTGGNLLWGSNALIVDSSSKIYSHSFIAVNSDENQGAFFCFGYGHLFTQHVSATGTESWKVANPVTATTNGQNYPSMDDDGYNGVVVSWDDGRGVYAQDIDTLGNRQWGLTDAPVYTAYNGGSATGTQIISLKNHKAIAAIGADGSDIYAARFPDKSYTTTGVQELINDNSLSLFPNPTSGNLFIKNRSTQSSIEIVQLYNIIGQLVDQQNINLPASSGQEINLATQEKGIYLLKISGGENENLFKIVIE